MLLLDVNVLVYAHRAESPSHGKYAAWLSGALSGSAPVGLNDAVLSGFLRIVTHPRVFIDPTPLSVALQFCEALRGAPAATNVRPGAAHWGMFRDLLIASQASGNDVPDAYLAALAIERDATLISADRGFSRFPGLRFRLPISEEE